MVRAIIIAKVKISHMSTIGTLINSESTIFIMIAVGITSNSEIADAINFLDFNTLNKAKTIHKNMTEMTASL